jgi:hypothetical protein
VCVEEQRRHGPASLEGCTSAAEPNKPFFEASRDYGEERRMHVLEGQNLGMNSAVYFERDRSSAGCVRWARHRKCENGVAVGWLPPPSSSVPGFASGRARYGLPAA